MLRGRVVRLRLMVSVAVLGSVEVGLVLRTDSKTRILWVEAFSKLSIIGYKCVFAARNPLENVVTKVFNHHVLPALHVLDNDRFDGVVWVVLK